MKVLGHDAVRNGFFGQEINITTYNLCRINMFLHYIGFDKFDIACEDTLTNPSTGTTNLSELIVFNPPYSIKWAGDDTRCSSMTPRFAPAGVLAPKSKADLAFIMHSLSWLAANGTAAIVCFPGILYRGGAEKKIRQYLIDNNFIDCVIQLPSNLFFRHQHRHLHHGAERRTKRTARPCSSTPPKRVYQGDQQQYPPRPPAVR